MIAVLGERADMSGDGASRSSLDLPGRQEELLKAVFALGKPVVLVLVNGRPLSINWAAQNVPAILEAWQPGTEGGHAVADVLFGDAGPGGKLPVTFPRSSGFAPYYYAHNLSHQPEGARMYRSRYWDGPTPPLNPFGFGLRSQAVGFPLGPDELRYWSTSRGKWLQPAEAFDVWVGADSTATLHPELQVVR